VSNTLSSTNYSFRLTTTGGDSTTRTIINTVWRRQGSIQIPFMGKFP